MSRNQLKPRILLVPIAAGGGHVSSAEAIAQAISTHYPEQFELDVSELMPAYGFEALDRQHKEAWRRALERPWSVRLSQGLSDAFPRLTMWGQRHLLAGFAKELAERLQGSNVALVVATHPWINTALALAKKRYGLTLPFVSFIGLTVDATAIWADPWGERYLIGSERGKRVLTRLGVPGAKIDVVGYPVKQAFLHAPTKSEARAELGLAERFTCLIVLGREGVGNVPHRLVRWLRELAFPVQIVVIAGRNEALQRDLTSLNLDFLHVTGFVTNMETYMAAADVVVGKVSGATVFEALAVGRPVLATGKSYRSEDEYIRYLSAKDWGAFCPDKTRLQAQLTAYHDRPERLREVMQRTRALDFPGMSRRLAQYLVTYLETGEPAPELCSDGVDWP